MRGAVHPEEDAEVAVQAWDVRELWRYPVKSLGGERCDSLRLGPDGVLGDRVLAILDVESGRVLSAKRHARMLEASASWSDAGVTIVLPDGRALRSDDGDADGALSAWLGRAVRLVTAGEGACVAESQPDPEDAASVGTFLLPGGRLVDEAPVHLLSTADLRAGRASYPDGAWDVRRFRPNIVLDGGGFDLDGAGPPGAVLTIGGSLLAVTGPCRRCVMVTRGQHGLAADPGILRSLARSHRASLGAYAAVLRPGEVCSGDTATAARPPAVPSGGAPGDPRLGGRVGGR